MRATLEIKTKHPKAVLEAIAVDEETSKRVRIRPGAKDGVLRVVIEADDFSALRAGVTTYMRLAKAALAGLGE
ncbi:MAG: CTAG/PCC1 family protein [Candidatus Aenigmatarchaeota archaeon]|nr:MAG: CTAG/PCC1 family protein [Candidatus Aenigmarchaeota archaeon]